MSGWRVFTSWRALPDGFTQETCLSRPNWEAARREARQLACLNGVRYVSVQGPDDVVVGEYDRITNRWREYVREVR